MKVLFVNTHWSNRGDEAAFRPLLDSVLKHCPDWSVDVMFKDRKDVQEFPYPSVEHFSFVERPANNLEALYLLLFGKSKSTSIQNAIQRMASADAIIYSPGGAVISDRFWFTKQTEYLLPFIVARKYHIPIMVAAPSMGSFEHNKNWQNWFIKNYLRAANPLIVREPISEKYLHSIGVDSKVTIDSAFLDEPDEKMCEISLKQDKELSSFLSSRKVIAITVTDFAWHVQYESYKVVLNHIKTAIRDFISWLQKQGFAVLFIPQLFGNQKDLECIAQFANENTMVLSNSYDTYMQQYIIAQCYATIGMRYHSNIFSAKGGKPFIAIAYEEKMIGFMQEHHLDEYMVTLQDLSSVRLMHSFEKMEANYDSYQKQLLENRELFRAKAQETENAIIEFLTQLHKSA